MSILPGISLAGAIDVSESSLRLTMQRGIKKEQQYANWEWVGESQ